MSSPPVDGDTFHPSRGDPRSKSVTKKLIGQRVLRNEDARLLTGQAQFVDDVEIPGLLHAAFLRSDHAHGRLLSMDVTAAPTTGRGRRLHGGRYGRRLGAGP